MTARSAVLISCGSMKQSKPTTPFAIGRDWRNLRVRTVHRGVPFRRSATPLNHQPFEDSEWQSDAFEAEFLMPVEPILGLRLKTAARPDRRVDVLIAAIKAEMKQAPGSTAAHRAPVPESPAARRKRPRFPGVERAPDVSPSPRRRSADRPCARVRAATLRPSCA